MKHVKCLIYNTKRLKCSFPTCSRHQSMEFFSPNNFDENECTLTAIRKRVVCKLNSDMHYNTLGQHNRQYWLVNTVPLTVHSAYLYMGSNVLTGNSKMTAMQIFQLLLNWSWNVFIENVRLVYQDNGDKNKVCGAKGKNIIIHC